MLSNLREISREHSSLRKDMKIPTLQTTNFSCWPVMTESLNWLRRLLKMIQIQESIQPLILLSPLLLLVVLNIFNGLSNKLWRKIQKSLSITKLLQKPWSMMILELLKPRLLSKSRLRNLSLHPLHKKMIWYWVNNNYVNKLTLRVNKCPLKRNRPKLLKNLMMKTKMTMMRMRRMMSKKSENIRNEIPDYY